MYFTPKAGGSIEVFEIHHIEDTNFDAPGWYWRPCFPGCLPDGDPVGPFPTEQAALADATEMDDAVNEENDQWKEKS